MMWFGRRPVLRRSASAQPRLRRRREIDASDVQILSSLPDPCHSSLSLPVYPSSSISLSLTSPFSPLLFRSSLSLSAWSAFSSSLCSSFQSSSPGGARVPLQLASPLCASRLSSSFSVSSSRFESSSRLPPASSSFAASASSSSLFSSSFCSVSSPASSPAASPSEVSRQPLFPSGPVESEPWNSVYTRDAQSAAAAAVAAVAAGPVARPTHRAVRPAPSSSVSSVSLPRSPALASARARVGCSTQLKSQAAHAAARFGVSRTGERRNAEPSPSAAPPEPRASVASRRKIVSSHTEWEWRMQERERLAQRLAAGPEWPQTSAPPEQQLEKQAVLGDMPGLRDGENESQAMFVSPDRNRMRVEGSSGSESRKVEKEISSRATGGVDRETETQECEGGGTQQVEAQRFAQRGGRFIEGWRKLFAFFSRRHTPASRANFPYSEHALSSPILVADKKGSSLRTRPQSSTQTSSVVPIASSCEASSSVAAAASAFDASTGEESCKAKCCPSSLLEYPQFLLSAKTRLTHRLTRNKRLRETKTSASSEPKDSSPAPHSRESSSSSPLSPSDSSTASSPSRLAPPGLVKSFLGFLAFLPLRVFSVSFFAPLRSLLLRLCQRVCRPFAGPLVDEHRVSESSRENKQGDDPQEVAALLEEARRAARRRAEAAERAAALRAAKTLQQSARPPSRTFREIRFRLLRQGDGAAFEGRLGLDLVRELEGDFLLGRAAPAAGEQKGTESGESETKKAKTGDSDTGARITGEEGGEIGQKHRRVSFELREEAMGGKGTYYASPSIRNRKEEKVSTHAEGGKTEAVSPPDAGHFPDRGREEREGEEESAEALPDHKRGPGKELEEGRDSQVRGEESGRSSLSQERESFRSQRVSAEGQEVEAASVKALEEAKSNDRPDGESNELRRLSPTSQTEQEGSVEKEGTSEATMNDQDETGKEKQDQREVPVPRALRLNSGSVAFPEAPKSGLAEALSSPLPPLDEWMRNSLCGSGAWGEKHRRAVDGDTSGQPIASPLPPFLAAAQERLVSLYAAATAAHQEASQARQAAAAAAAEALTLSVQGGVRPSSTPQLVGAEDSNTPAARPQSSSSDSLSPSRDEDPPADPRPLKRGCSSASVALPSGASSPAVTLADASAKAAEARDAASAAALRAEAAKMEFLKEEEAFRSCVADHQKRLRQCLAFSPEAVRSQQGASERLPQMGPKETLVSGVEGREPSRGDELRPEKAESVLAKVLGQVEPPEAFPSFEPDSQVWKNVAFATAAAEPVPAPYPGAWSPYPPLSAFPGSPGPAVGGWNTLLGPRSRGGHFPGLHSPGNAFGYSGPGERGPNERASGPVGGRGPLPPTSLRGDLFPVPPFWPVPRAAGGFRAPPSLPPWNPRAPDLRWLTFLYGEIQGVKEVTKFYRGGRGVASVEECQRALGLVLMSLNVDLLVLPADINRVVSQVRPVLNSWEQAFSEASSMIRFFAEDSRFGKSRCLAIIKDAGALLECDEALHPDGATPKMSARGGATPEEPHGSSTTLAQAGTQAFVQRSPASQPHPVDALSPEAASSSKADSSAETTSSPDGASLPEGSLPLSLQEPAARLEALLTHRRVLGRLPPILLPGHSDPVEVKAFFNVPGFLGGLRQDIATLNFAMHALKRENTCTLDDGSSISLWDMQRPAASRPPRPEKVRSEAARKAPAPREIKSINALAPRKEVPGRDRKPVQDTAGASAVEAKLEKAAPVKQGTDATERKPAESTAELLQSIQREQEARRLADVESFVEPEFAPHCSSISLPSAASCRPDDSPKAWLGDAHGEQIVGGSAFGFVEQQMRAKKMESKTKQTTEKPRKEGDWETLHVKDLTIGALARHLKVPESDLLGVATLLLEGTPGRGTVTSSTRLDEDEAEFLSDELGKLNCLRITRGELREERGDYRAPAVVAVLGHVDHGKTTLLDKLRSSHVADFEAGGITQAVSSGSLVLASQNQRLTFIDTPGHAAFASMRKRGAAATDLCVLVVAADEGVKAQTLECLDIIRKSGTPWIVALNKVDKPGADIERVKKQFADLGVISDDAGGDIPFIPISAKTGEGLDQLEAALTLLQEDMPHLYGAGPPSDASRAHARAARGYVLESRMDKQKGRCIQVIVRSGWLEPGKWVVIGRNSGRIKKIWRSGEHVELKMAGPNEAVEIAGLGDLQASAGQALVQAANAQQAAKLAGMAERLDLRRQLRRAEASTAQAAKFAVEDLALKTASNLRRKQRKLSKYKQAVQNIKFVDELTDDDSEEADAEDLITTRQTVVQGIPQIGFIIKAADQGSLEAILQWIDTHNETVKAAQRLPEAVRGALKGAASERLRALADQRRSVELTEEEEAVDQSGEALQESERVLASRWLPICVLHCGVGPISVSDVNKAALTNSFVLGFGVSVLDNIDQVIHEKGVPVRNQNIIYRLFEDIEALYEYHFGSEFVYNQVGRMVVSRVATFTLKRSKGGIQTVVGVDVKDGTPSVHHFYSVMRDDNTLVEHLQIKSMQKNRQDVTTLQKGSRLGAIIFDSEFDDFQERDTINVFERSQRLPPDFLTSRRYLQSA
ncbi:elongation factor Tu GTP binding domain-containing protein [Toxoplasma gondii ME49]|uniref:Elongation factor Tu GTP-binding domain-containing protein n=3 Tax=Toxoplasma gondii TaxID=5811 RepID=A0A125YMW2_TOXGV|nr:elongation factor Tu GTP binding domain-containing protein [Toxoplasma gondii ME49]EPT25308.1 elongation factor Tu GTP binding domain-containing protein [Toxoplasma gondii ME49]ESS34620.1 elongation factor Tu GTP binding domain-containing protein [Toxoplasma gondii VEG]CEL78760.1 TPA: elongation factor Tu GTP-binding domain-containing protein [Toxoplasma gondii VEG]|eukprot:XP_018635128.1 elongation factor Tu GTP binding domain-containing protein [Toxoplasma gondii ME49]